MNFFYKYLVTAFSILLPALNAIAEQPEFEFGQVSKKELAATIYEMEPDAPAAILFDHCIISVDIDRDGIKVNYNHTRRLKIYSHEGYIWASYSMMLYHDQNSKEHISGLKGFTYNLVDGHVVKTKIDKSCVFQQKVDKKKDLFTFTFPDVREGSIIEFTYNKTSGFLNRIDPWYFQQLIPVAWSELYFSVPQYLDYLHIPGGFETITLVDSMKSRKITLTSSSSERTGGRLAASGSIFSSKSLTFNVYTDHWIAANMPSLKQEKYIGNIRDYFQKIEFQLASMKFGNSFQDVLGTWETINRRLLQDTDNFGPNMLKRDFYNSVLDTLVKDGMSPGSKALVITNFVSSGIKWNGIHDFIPDNNIKKVFYEKVGTSSEINALLISMLRSAGLDAEPVIISTRDNGLISRTYPLVDKFNHLIAATWIGDSVLLLDASDPDVPAGMLPRNCLNGTGRCISEKYSRWINLDPVKSYDIINSSNFSIRDNKYIGEMIINKSGYAAIDSKSSLRIFGEDRYIENIKRLNPGWKITDYSLDVLNGNKDEMSEKYQLETSDGLLVTGSLIYIDPVISSSLKENPLKIDDRKYPVNFGEAVNQEYLINIKVPGNYQVEEIPEPVHYLMPDRSADFTYIAETVDSIIHVNINLEIKKGIYMPKDYKSLRDFFSLVAQKSNEQIVLKRKQ